MISATRRWLKRNRKNIGIGVGVLSAGYYAGQYVIGKISETRERMTNERIAKENLRRRFKQNQEDCTFTVLALLPTAAENIIEALPAESIADELQQQRAEKLGRSTATSEISPSDLSSNASPPPDNEDGTSNVDPRNDSFLHTSQMELSSTGRVSTGAMLQRKSKVQLWSELKISSITRSFTMIYMLALLNLLTRIQLNLLGRRSYISSVVSLASPPGQSSTISLENHDDEKGGNNWGTDFETNRKYLTFSWWLLHRGWRDLLQKIETAVKEVFGPVHPREDVTFERLSRLVIEVRKLVEGDTEEARRNHKWLEYLLPPREQEDFVLRESGILVDTGTISPPANIYTADPTIADLSSSTLSSQLPSLSNDPLRRLLDETADLIDSPAASHILTLLLDTLFSQLTDISIKQQAYKFADAFDQAGTVEEIPETGTSDQGQAKAKLAPILAVMTRQAHIIGNGVPNVYVQAMEDVRELEAFAAVIYSSNFGFESIMQADGSANIEEQQFRSRSAGSDTPKIRNEGVIDTTWGVLEGVWNRLAGT